MKYAIVLASIAAFSVTPALAGSKGGRGGSLLGGLVTSVASITTAVSNVKVLNNVAVLSGNGILNGNRVSVGRGGIGIGNGGHGCGCN
jgi:hypothetical protein